MRQRLTPILATIRPFLAAFLLCLVAYHNSLFNGFMLDDHVILFGESGVANKTFFGLFTDYQHIFYRPVGHWVLFFSHRLFGTGVFFYHLTNLMLFSVIVALFYAIVRALSGDKALAALTALLYALHPINGMLVNYVTANIISTFVITLQLSFLFFLKYWENRRRGLWALSLFCFILSLFSHEMSLPFPAYVFCALYFLKNQKWTSALKASLPFWILSLGYYLFRAVFFSLEGSLGVVVKLLSIPQVYISSLAALLGWYAGKLVLPANIIFLWTVAFERLSFVTGTFQFIGVSLIALYLIFIRWRKGLKPFALALFLTGLAPAFVAAYAHFPFADPIIEPHWFYFSSLGFFILAAHLLLWLRDKIRRPAWNIIVAGIALSLLLILWQQNTCWRDQETYCRYWLSQNRGNMTPYYGLGKSLLRKGRHEQAIRLFDQSRKVGHYQSAFVLADTGFAHFQNGDPDTALEYYRKALAENPRYSVTYYYLGLLHLWQGDRAKAHEAFAAARSLYPRDPRYQRYFEAPHPERDAPPP